MKTALKLGPTDGGREVALEDFEHALWEEGYRYELIDGRLSVSPVPEVPEGWVAQWINFELSLYGRANPEIINHVNCAARVFIPRRRGATNPQPDVAAYEDFPVHLDYREIRWRETSPLLVVEVVSRDDAQKDLVRNVELYLAVPSIKEYWVFDNRDSDEHPFLTVHRRRGKRWVISTYRRGETYSTKLLPGFTLLLNPQP